MNEEVPFSSCSRHHKEGLPDQLLFQVQVCTAKISSRRKWYDVYVVIYMVERRFGYIFMVIYML